MFSRRSATGKGDPFGDHVPTKNRAQLPCQIKILRRTEGALGYPGPSPLGKPPSDTHGLPGPTQISGVSSGVFWGGTCTGGVPQGVQVCTSITCASGCSGQREPWGAHSPLLGAWLAGDSPPYPTMDASCWPC